MKLQKIQQTSTKRSGGYFVNFLGILAALAIAFGGLFLVQGGLAREEEKLMAAGGMLELPPPITEMEVTDTGDTIINTLLTEEELLRVAASLTEPVDVRLHEPLQGQLSMSQAVECAQTWLEDFMMPLLGISGPSIAQYRTNCYLWTPETGKSDQEAQPWLSYWSVSLSNQEIEASFLLNAVSGQVLDVLVGCTAPVEHQDQEDLIALFDAYTSSFGEYGNHTIIFNGESDFGAKKLPWYQPIGDNGLYTVMMASSTISMSRGADSNTLVSQELFSIHLYLSLDSKEE